ncbi:MAG: hypothetical protein ABSB56_02515 [Nitrososphaerales archaeon]
MQLQTMKTNRTSHRATASALSVMLATIMLLGLAGLPALTVHAASFNDVQIFVNTSANLQYNYFLSAYNLTGSQVATYQSSFPAAAFELPAGSYLFTVSALREGYPSCPMCAEPGVEAGQANGGASSSSNSGSTTAMPAFLIQSASEYGYAVETVSGPATFTIQTQNVTLLPTSPVTVKVTFANGTAAVGADVSASIIGQNYYWWNPSSSVVMSNQTNNLGIAHLVLPQAPAVITAWDWVPVNRTLDNSTVPDKIGGQPINVTLYWQTTYVGLSASAIVIPPNNSVSLTLHYQQPENWIVPMGVKTSTANSSGASTGTIADQPTGVPSTVQSAPSQTGSQIQYYLPSAVPSIEAALGTTGSTTTSSNALLGGGVTTIAIGAAAVILATLGVAVVILRTRPHHQ